MEKNNLNKETFESKIEKLKVKFHPEIYQTIMITQAVPFPIIEQLDLGFNNTISGQE